MTRAMSYSIASSSTVVVNAQWQTPAIPLRPEPSEKSMRTELPRGRESAEALKKDMQAFTVSELRSVRARKAFSLVSGCGIRE